MLSYDHNDQNNSVLPQSEPNSYDPQYVLICIHENYQHQLTESAYISVKMILIHIIICFALIPFCTFLMDFT